MGNNMWIREDLLERLESVDMGPGVHNKQDALKFLLDFYEKYKGKHPITKS